MTTDERPAPGDASARSAEQRLRRLLQVQQLLFQVSREIGPALELGPVLDTVLRAMRELVDFKGGSICLVEDGVIRLVVSDPPVSSEVRDLRLPLDQGLSGLIVRTGEPLYSRDVQHDERTSRAITQLGSNATIRSFIGVPLVVLGEVIGLLQVDSAEPDAFGSDDLDVLTGLGTLVAGAIESARRHEAVVELERLKSDFIARVSHELRTPIAIMSGFADTLAEYGPQLSESERAEFLERIRYATTRLRYVVEEILTLSALETGDRVPDVSDVDVGVLVLDMLQRVDGAHEVTADVPAGTVVRSDASVIGRVLISLVDNAVKYGGGGAVRARRDGNGVTIDVEDRGPGVDPAIGARIFERFVRGDHTVEGMGLGLAIARTLADRLGGSLVHETLDGGTRFRLVVPDLPA